MLPPQRLWRFPKVVEAMAVASVVARIRVRTLLEIRSDMDVAFRDASVKGPLWDEVSRKLAALGYHRSAKKCKEKFENVYKYHRRTKEGRTGKSEGKTYRFFDQLEALENQPSTPGTTHHHQAKPHHQSTMAAAAANNGKYYSIISCTTPYN
ncbi:trihelix transcription factor GT-2-like [Prunus yedoensis var. nudiflora]|uniref:Trihelix transcription factor GT-2-like n=1 Tax=Prunus yedoensis var. nudiflora TaxID=2094558 RepID=A0A314YK17_PRUYE|nr:trihelix transcription factor GT-2-like [Prunus yedoensis var. nudiflora]